MSRPHLAAGLGACLAGLALSAAAAQAAPTGTIAARDEGGGARGFAASVTWDGCPALCDWKINVDEVNDPSKCVQSAELTPTQRPDGGAFGSRPPYTANGTQVDGVTGISRLLPDFAPKHYVECLAATGLTPPQDPAHPKPQPTGCYSPQEIYGSVPGIDLSGRCAVLIPLGYAEVDVKPFQQPKTTFVPAPARPSATAAPQGLSRAGAVAALRAKHVKGTITCRRLSAARQRCTAKAKHRSRRYTVTRTATGVRVRHTR